MRWVVVIVAACVAGGCMGGGVPPSVWPPANFQLVVEELQGEGNSVHVVRRFQVDASGVVAYGTSSEPMVDPTSGVSLPVFDRLAVYRLEPKSVRALARRLDRLGIGDVVVEPEALPVVGSLGLSIQWRAFDQNRTLPSGNRLRGSMAEILALVSAHLPPGESFGVTMSRPVVPVLRGAPQPAVGAEGALVAHTEMLADNPNDPGLLLAAFALACRVGQRDYATRLLERWELAQSAQSGSMAFGDDPGAIPRNRARRFEAFMPQGG